MSKNIFRISAALPVIALFSFLAVTSCGSRYSVEGHWEGGVGNTVALYEDTGSADSPVLIDSVEVDSDGNFSFSGKADYPKRYVLKYKKVQKSIFVGKKPVHISLAERRDTTKSGNERIVTDFAIEADRQQSILENGEGFNLSNSVLELGCMLMLSKAEEGEYDIDSIVYGISLAKERFAETIYEYLDTTRNDVAATYFIRDFMLTYRPIEEVVNAYDSLSEAVRQSPQGVQLAEKIRHASNNNIGGMPEDFKLPTPDDGSFSLYQLRGHYVILDFWASWCKPCLAEMPNVKAIYERYHKDGLEILGVSLDKDKEAWINAIAEYELPWHHVSSLQEWDCPVAKEFNVHGIPKMYILNPEGKIIDMDLRGEALADRVSEIYNQN